MNARLPRLAGIALFATGLALLPLPALAISIGLLDDFQDGTAQGWHTAGGNLPQDPLTVTLDGGPLGAGDSYVSLVSDGSSRLVGNQRASDWLGDYTAAGVTRIQLDARNPNAFDVTLRIGFQGAGTRFTESAVSSPQVLGAGSDWTTLTFDVDAASLTPTGTAPAATTIANVTYLRVLENSAVDFRGSLTAGSVHIDNVATVPEPGSALLLGLGLTGLAFVRRRSSALGD